MQNSVKDLYNSKKNNKKEEELQERVAKLELTKRQANQARTGRADQNLDSHHAGLGNNFVNQKIPPPPPLWQLIHDPNGPFKSRPAREIAPRIGTVKLKGVDLPNF